MHITKFASGRQTLKLSRSDWEKIGKLAGFMDDDGGIDSHMGQFNHDSSVVIDGKDVPVIVGYEGHAGSTGRRESLGQPLEEDEGQSIEIVDIRGVNPDGSLGDSVMDLLGDSQIMALEREIVGL